MRDHTVLPATHVYPQVEWTILPLLLSRRASLYFVRYSFPILLRVGGWVGPSGRLHTKMLYPRTVIHLSTGQAQCRITSFTWTMAKPCMEQSSNHCHYSNFSGFLQKTTKNISFHKVAPGILVCVQCPRSTFAHAMLICTFLTNYVHPTQSLVPKWYDTRLGHEGLQSSPVQSLTPSQSRSRWDRD